MMSSSFRMLDLVLASLSGASRVGAAAVGREGAEGRLDDLPQHLEVERLEIRDIDADGAGAVGSEMREPGGVGSHPVGEVDDERRLARGERGRRGLSLLSGR